MSHAKTCRLVEGDPELALEMKARLKHAGEFALVAQVDDLSIFERDNHSHGFDIHTAPRPTGRWGPRHRTLGLDPGVLQVDVVGNEIVMIEVLRKNSAYASTPGKARPRGHSRAMKAAGTTSEIVEGGARHWYVVGWSQEVGWGIMADLPPFLTKAEAEAEYWRLQAIESEAVPDGP